jgi:hypothetical protein
MLEALLVGDRAPEEMAQLALGRLREKIPQLEQALAGSMAPHQRFILTRQLAHIDFLDEALEQVSREIGERLSPFETAAATRLDPVPGIAMGVAEVIIAEVGANVSRFPTAGHLASWTGICPGNRQSAGKRFSGKTRKGNQALRTVLINAAHAASMKSGSYLQAQYRRLVPRLGRKKAIVALARRILEIVYHLLQEPQSVFREQGAHYMQTERKERAKAHHLRQLRAPRLPYTGTLSNLKEAYFHTNLGSASGVAGEHRDCSPFPPVTGSQTGCLGSRECHCVRSSCPIGLMYAILQP